MDPSSRAEGRRTTRLPSLIPAVASGVMLGASYWAPAAPALALLAWVWMIPLLAGTARSTAFLLLTRAWVAMLTGCSIAQWWMSAFTPGACLVFVAGSFITLVPWIAFLAARRWLGHAAALLMLPSFWTLWEWLYLRSEASFGWLVLSVSQSSLYPLIQHADLGGSWLISFWLVVSNVALTRAIEIPTRRVARIALTATAVLALPLGWWMVRIMTDDPASGTISVVAVQPDVDPNEKWTGRGAIIAIEKVVEYTDEAMDGRAADLIVWPETALAMPLEQSSRLRAFIHEAVADWQTPVLAGTMDMAAAGRPEEGSFVATYLLTPDASRAITTTGPYYKHRLVPFVEFVPLADRWPQLRKMSVDASGGSRWLTGGRPHTFDVTTGDGRRVSVASQICYDAIYPAGSRDHVARGAQLLTFATNDAWYGRTLGQRIIAAAARLRAVETRRTVVRVANSGLTEFVDRYGRTWRSLPEWRPGWALERVELHSSITPFVRFPHAMPLLCVVLIGAIVAGGIRRRQSWGRHPCRPGGRVGGDAQP